MKLCEILCEAFLRCKETIFRRYYKFLGGSPALSGYRLQTTFSSPSRQDRSAYHVEQYNTVHCAWSLTYTKLHKVSLRSGGDIKAQKYDFLVFLGVAKVGGWPAVTSAEICRYGGLDQLSAALTTLTQGSPQALNDSRRVCLGAVIQNSSRKVSGVAPKPDLTEQKN
jgi:hypothetical protein